MCGLLVNHNQLLSVADYLLNRAGLPLIALQIMNGCLSQPCILLLWSQ